MRRLEAIQNFIGQRKGAIPFLIEGYPFEKVCSLAQKLLIDGAFASEAIARHKFPTLFDPTQLTESVKALPSMQGAQLEARGSWAMVARAEKRVEPMESRDTLTEDTITSDPPAEHIRKSNGKLMRPDTNIPQGVGAKMQHGFHRLLLYIFHTLRSIRYSTRCKDILKNAAMLSRRSGCRTLSSRRDWKFPSNMN